MSSGDEGSQLPAALRESLCRGAEVEFAVAFGSRVTGEPTPSSDFDIAVKFADDLSANERFQTRCFLSGDLQREETSFVDITDIEELPLAVAHDAANGEFVCGDERAFRRFKSDIEETFAKRRDEIRRHQREVIDRIAEGGLRG